jgi:hypothetical protein
MYDKGDLVELARFGYAPESDSDRVFGTVLDAHEPADHFVPRYRVRILPRPNLQVKVDEFSSNPHERTITVMEYDIAGKTEGKSQE